MNFPVNKILMKNGKEVGIIGTINSLSEQKYIILSKFGITVLLIMPYSANHQQWAKDQGFNYDTDLVESGVVIEGELVCNCRRGKQEYDNEYLITGYLLKAREVQSREQYKQTGILREGD